MLALTRLIVTEELTFKSFIDINGGKISIHGDALDQRIYFKWIFLTLIICLICTLIFILPFKIASPATLTIPNRPRDGP